MALPNYSTRTPFLDPSFSYGGSQPGQETELNNFWLEQNPDAMYYRWLNAQGLGGNDARSRTAQGYYQEYMRGFQSARGNNLELKLKDYLAGMNVDNMLNSMSNREMGIDTGRYSGRDRWGMRG